MGRKALVTGGSSGIGRGIVRELAAAGYDVAFTYYNHPEKADELAADLIRGTGRTIHHFQAKLEEEDAAPRAVDQAVEKLGHLDVLVNNAGRTILGHILSMDTERINYIYNLNFRSYILAAQQAARHMKEHGQGGNIVFITSTRGNSPHIGDAVYGGLKAGIQRAAKTLALELSAYCIRVNCIAPGCIPMGKETDGRYLDEFDDFRQRIPLQRFGTEDDVSKSVLWMVSDSASYVTGQTLHIDGGLALPGMEEIGYRHKKRDNS